MVIETVGVHETPLATSLTNWVSYRSHFDTWGVASLKDNGEVGFWGGWVRTKE